MHVHNAVYTPYTMHLWTVKMVYVYTYIQYICTYAVYCDYHTYTFYHITTSGLQGGGGGGAAQGGGAAEEGRPGIPLTM